MRDETRSGTPDGAGAHPAGPQDGYAGHDARQPSAAAVQPVAHVHYSVEWDTSERGGGDAD
ncbi:hypothetical protein R5W24_002917 [Gemmata sp. JC717]|uniref:hypothetical protein n=1 Tax=Gemmata algarum TaxID=2975278 RepID=UPI0021BBA18B|nr:hypothetical protein [Gemmata algarum]MDY3553803.1 hypothetical protein [Gemmata algarum]